jgi:DNA invertase Pin-like site-specific DNA recombinase
LEKYVSYLRVSTGKQGRSGLGLEAQRETVTRFIKNDGCLLKEYIEIESGRRNDRHQLKLALEHCRDTGATLVFAKLDRLSRNVAFISQLMEEGGVDFRACDFPQATRLTLHLLAAVAEHEREMISTRTREALAAARARGVRLGRNNLTMDGAERGWRRSAESRRARANAFAEKRSRLIYQYLDTGLSLRGVARRLNEEGLLTARGGRWTASAVKNAVLRAQKVEGG